ncbi:MAG: hypothetical protein LAN36_06690 [Acidobacteriia bacterium]|nr:hypothetical protein [Terriglobia bacterium]
MRRRPWVVAAMLVIPASSWCQPQDQNQAQAGGQSTAAAQPQAAQASAPQQQSLGDAARKAREQKKETPKSAKVFTNDNLSAVGGVSTVGKEPAPGGEAAAEGTAAGGTPTAGTAEDEKSWRDKFAELRRKLAQDQADLDVMERELGVLNLQNYSDPVKAMQQGMTRDDINKKTAAIEGKKKQVAADQQAISDAEDDLRKSGGDSGWAR